MRLLLLFCLLVSGPVRAQSDTVRHYLNENFQPAKADNAIYQGLSYKQAETWAFVVRNRVTGKVILRSFYLDAQLKRLHGRYAYFFDDGRPQILGQYENGRETGLWKKFDGEGLLTDSTIYRMGEPLERAVFTYYDNRKLKTSSYENRTTRQSLQRVYAEDGTLYQEKDFTGKTGEKRIYYSTGNLYLRQRVEEGATNFINTYYHEDGKEMTEEEQRMTRDAMAFRDPFYRPGSGTGGFFLPGGFTGAAKKSVPDYPGGYFNMMVYLNRYLVLPKQYRKEPRPEFEVSFLLDSKGRAHQVKVLSHKDPELEKKLQRLFRSMDRWNMNGWRAFGPIRMTILVGKPAR